MSDEQHKYVEAQVIGGLLMNPRLLPTIEGIIDPDDFYFLKHHYIYEAIRTAYDQASDINLTMIATILNDRDQLSEIGGERELTFMVAGCEDHLKAPFYARYVRNVGLRVKMLQGFDDAKAAIMQNVSFDDTMAKAQNILDSVATRLKNSNQHSAEDVAGELMEDVIAVQEGERQTFGIATGLTMYDALLHGLQDSELVIGAGRPGMGKSTWLLQLMLQASSNGKWVGIWSGEMSRKAIGQRAIARLAGVNIARARGRMSDQEYRRYLNAAAEFGKLPIHFWETPAITPQKLRTFALQNRDQLDLIIVDYLGLMNGMAYGRSPYEQTTGISKALKELAREMDIPVVAAAQLSRACEERADKRPLLSDLRDSGSIEQDADVVTFLYRDHYYNESADPHDLQLIVAKNRNGETGIIKAYCDFATMTIADGTTRRVNFGNEAAS